MSKILLEGFKSVQTETIELPRNIIGTRDIVYLKEIDSVPYIFIGSKKLNVISAGDLAKFTTYQQEDHPNLNINDLQLTIIEG